MSKEKFFFTLAILAAIIFVALLPFAHPYPLSFVLKAVPVSSLMVLTAMKMKGRERVILLLALLFCLAGDILLDLDRVAYFKAALAVFLIGHIFYVIFFLRKRNFEKSRLPWIIGVALYAIILAIILRGIDRGLLVPVMAYLTVISLMTIAALVKNPFSKMVAAGALVFLFSDTIIAVNKFLQPIPYSTVFNIGLYFTAQILIIRGLLREKDTL